MKFYRYLKKSILFILIMVLFLSTIPFSASAFSTEFYDFANFTEEESMAFLSDCNIDIPEEFLQENDLPSLTLGLILQAYHYPNKAFCFNYNVTQAYAEEIRLAVRSYMNLDAIPTVASETTYELQYNTVMNEDGEWVTSGGYYNPKWLNYNCYAYAINRAENPYFEHYDPSPYIQYQPGDMSGMGNFNSTSTIDQLATLVKEDLLAMGYSEVSISSTIPTIDNSQELICVRRASFHDYHFMHYDLDTDAWYHKTGNTAVLKYNYIPSNNLYWYREFSFQGEEWIYVATSEYDWAKYDSEIRFITYSKNQINIGAETTAREFIQAGKDIFCELQFTDSGIFDIELISTYSFDYEIYNTNFDIVLSGNGTTIEECFSVTAGKYYLRMNFDSENLAHYIDVSIDEHNHSYDTCVDASKLAHRCICACGATALASHYVFADDIIPGNNYAPCRGCGRVLNLQRDHYESIASITKVSVNGSYILDNGIVVLVDEDIEAYLNGTLQFYYPEDVPVTQ